MSPAQRAVLELAKKNGLTPMEQSAEFMLHDLVEACLGVLRSQTKLFADLGEQGQDSAIQSISSQLKKTVYTAAQILQGAEVIQVPVTLTGLTSKKAIQITGEIDSSDPGRFQLMDKAHQKAKVIIVLQEMNYFEGMSDIQSDKDQKSLALDGAAPATGKGGKKKAEPKPVEIAPKMLDDARDFVIIQQNASVDALQNLFKINRLKADTIMELLEKEGTVRFVGTDATGRYELVRPGATYANEPGGDTAPDDVSNGDVGPNEPALTELTDELYAQIKASVIARQNADLGVLIVDHGVSDEVGQQAIDRLEMEEVISTEDDLGGRAILVGGV